MSDPAPTPLHAAPTNPESFTPTPNHAPGEQIGKYMLMERLGEGGFGVVYLAEQREPVRRRVALKILKAGMDTAEVVARFEAERQALAVMDHPGVAKVLDAGLTPDHRPFFAMEYVAGEAISSYCDRVRMGMRDRIELFRSVCHAVHHAHQKGIIHRDLKPSNILVTEVDGKATPKVIDFGIAKAMSGRLTDRTMYTGLGRFLGTPEYMSPEQAGGSAVDVDTRADVYALGVILYELLTGLLPFDTRELRDAGLDAIQKLLREVEPKKPSTRLATASSHDLAQRRGTSVHALERSLRGDLDWVVMKCLEKDRTRRYESVSALAQDVERYLGDEPVLAGPPELSYRAGKFLRRHRVGVAFAATASVLLAAGVAGTLVFAVRERGQRRQLEQRERDLLQVTQFQTAMLGGIDPEQAGARLRTRLERDTPALAEPLRGVNATDVALDFINQTILAPASGAIDAQFKDRPTIDATLRQSLAETYSRLGMLDRALPLLRRTLELRRAALGDDHADTITAIGNVGYILHALGRLDEAEVFFAEAVERSERVHGAEHADTAAHLSNLGLLRVDQGRALDALPLYRRALEIQTRARGPDDADALLYENNLGGALEATGDYAGAEKHYRRSLEGTIRATGEESSESFAGMNNLAGVLEAQGKYDQAVDLYRRSLEGRRRLLGSAHPATLLALNNLGYILTRSDRAGEAETLLLEGLATARASLGESHPRTLTLRHNLANAIRKGGEFAKAEAEFRAVAAARAEHLGASHPDTLTTRLSLGLSIRDQQRLREAVLEFEAAAELAATNPEGGGAIAQALRQTLAETYDLLDAKEPAEGWKRKAESLREDPSRK